MSKSFVISGAKVYLAVNGIKIGRVTGFSYNAQSPMKAIHGIDSNEAFELAPTTSSINGSINVIKFQADGGAEGMGAIPVSQEIVSGRYFSMILIERNSSSVIFRADYCVVQGQSWQVQAKGLIVGTINFSALTWSNEVSPSNATGIFSTDR